MITKNAFLDKVLEKIKPHGPIKARAMFGGYGIYFEEIIFASIIEDKLYFRVDDINRKEFEKHHSEPFVYMGGRKPVVMPYMTLPEEVFNNPKMLKKYIQSAYEASLRYRMKQKKKRR